MVRSGRDFGAERCLPTREARDLHDDDPMRFRGHPLERASGVDGQSGPGLFERLLERPRGFMDYGESPEVGVEREAEEEIGVDIVLDGLLNVYVSGFPGKPAYTLGFVYRGHLDSETFRLKPDEIEDASWFTVDKALTLTRNPFAKWALVDFFLQSGEARAALKVKRHGAAPQPTGSDRPTVFLDRDGVINRGRAGDVRTPEQFQFLPDAIDGMRLLQDRGWQLVIVTNQDAAGWELLPGGQ